MNIRPTIETDHLALWEMLKPVFRAGDTYAIDPNISESAATAYWTGADGGSYIIEDESGPLGTYYIKTNAQGGGAHVCNCGFVTAPNSGGKGVAPNRKVTKRCSLISCYPTICAQLIFGIALALIRSDACPKPLIIQEMA